MPKVIKKKRRNWENFRRARKLSQAGAVPHNIEEILFEKQSGLCFYCSGDLNLTGYHQDHKMPLAKGGLHDETNLCLACPSCNVRKSTKTVEQFMEVLVNHV
jgi:5-methylcytosine-specific restriction endonuclease McrA